MQLTPPPSSWTLLLLSKTPAALPSFSSPTCSVVSLSAHATRRLPAIFNHGHKAWAGAARLQLQELHRHFKSWAGSTSTMSSLMATPSMHRAQNQPCSSARGAGKHRYVPFLPLYCGSWVEIPPLPNTSHGPPPPRRHCSCGKEKLPVGNTTAAERRCCVPPPRTALCRGGLCTHQGISSYLTRKKKIIISKLSNSHFPRLPALGGCLTTCKRVLAFQRAADHQLSALAPNTR